MNDPFASGRLERELGHIAIELTQVNFAQLAALTVGPPPSTLTGAPTASFICVDPRRRGQKRAISVRADRIGCLVSGTRPPPEPDCDQPQPVQVLAMEIDYGASNACSICHTNGSRTRQRRAPRWLGFGFTYLCA